MMEKSAVAEHVWENHHPINWEETSVLDRAKGQGEPLLIMKKAMHIQMTPAEQRFKHISPCSVPVATVMQF